MPTRFPKSWLAGVACVALACGDKPPAEPVERPLTSTAKPADEQPKPPRRGRGRRKPAAAPWEATDPGLVLLVVMDTVRADHTSVCGYGRPTTPYLESLADLGAVHTCSAYSPGTWTIPSHATYFTGLPPSSHDMHHKGIPLDTEVPTLAERFAARGYQTALVSANPTLSRASGLWRGFDTVRVSPGLHTAWRGETLERVLDETLATVRHRKRLFLVVNLFDAHDPYPAIPDDAGWVPAQGPVDFHPARKDHHNLYRRWVENDIRDTERDTLLVAMRNGYDWGIHEADRNVRRVVERLRARRFLDQGVRIAITSDHGENLGDHGAIRHDGPPWDSVARVPLVLFDDRQPVPRLTDAVSAGVVHDWLWDGALPTPLSTPISTSVVHLDSRIDRRNAVAHWSSPHAKSLWIEGDWMRFDLAVDPGENAPTPMANAEIDALQPHVHALERSAHRAADRADGRFTAALEALGYVE